MQENTKNQLIIAASRVVWIIVIILASLDGIWTGMLIAITIGMLDTIVVDGFKLSDRLTIYDRILSFGNSRLNRQLSFGVLKEHFEGLYTEHELAEAVHELQRANVVTVNGKSNWR